MNPAADQFPPAFPARPAGRLALKQISLKLTIQELELLTSLTSDQLFRREFIDPKMPGYRPKFGELGLAKGILVRMRGLLDPGSVRRAVGTAE